MSNFSTIFWVLAGGFLPAILWLIFWLREDALNPESNFMILKTFLAGSLAVILVLPLEKIVDNYFPGMGFAPFILWAILEEGLKFLVAYFVALRTRADDDPIDPMIYMITAALGFAALENVLFIINALCDHNNFCMTIITPNGIMNGVLMGNMRFIGSSLLHTVSSATIGVALAFNFYKSKTKKIIWTSLAFILAVILHSVFNLYIKNQNDLGTFLTFGTVWAGITILMLMFEKVKNMNLQSIDQISTDDTFPQN